MKTSYVIRYVLSDLCHSGNRAFTLINLIATSIAISVLVILLGGFLAFRKNGQQMMDKMGLAIESSPREERELTSEEKSKLKSLPGVDGVFTWTPGIFLFYNKEGRLFDGLGGRTIDLDDPLAKSVRDIRSNKPVRFMSKKDIGTNYDEIGLIVPFVILKQLSYLPPSASSEREETWQNVPFPEKLKILVREDQKGSIAVNIELPIVGVAAELEGGRYLITKDAYQILGSGWRNSFMPFLVDRYNNKLFPESKAPANVANPMTGVIPSVPETHATVYVKTRDDILPLLAQIRNKIWLKADCALEYYLQEYKQQETFFIAAAGGICFVMFFFAGVVLFATFQAYILRKVKEIGILKACGLSKSLVYCIFALEVIFVSVLSACMGISIGAFGASHIGRYIAKTLQLPQMDLFIFPPLYMGIIVLATLALSIVVTFFPVRMAVRVDPDQVIRG